MSIPDLVESAARARRLDEVVDRLAFFEAWVAASPVPARRSMLARCRAVAGVGDVAAESRPRSSTPRRSRRSNRRTPSCCTASGCAAHASRRRRARIFAGPPTRFAASAWPRGSSALKPSCARPGDDPPPRPLDDRRAHAAGAADRGPGRGRAHQPRGRRAALSQPAHDRLSPAQGVLEARRDVAHRARADRPAAVGAHRRSRGLAILPMRRRAP